MHRSSIIDPHVQVGLVAGDGGAAIWPLLIGPLAAKRHLMLGEPLRPDDALRLGLVSEVCGDDEVAARGLAWAHRLAAQAPLAVQGTKIAVNQHVKQALLTSFDVSTALEMTCFVSDDHVEAVDAFLQKRPPTFHAR
jgi:enoyl-CoA hydratase